MSLHAARASFSSRQTHHLIWWSTVRKRRPDPAEEKLARGGSMGFHRCCFECSFRLC
ncbi:hypothetical protein E1A91_A12G040400v1 [Gossypium mustelinum]|uniref:Uncharacterized protein n=2 Tax=Gossypium TaxID=3633 RepID=A0A5D2WPK0_GOSMU|nr:hypothetical protein ES332_A12G040800v1 [Gossypium tomentosum]TYJ03624.1 hypothetical protein E1A91_A12G040400v1 [Gossypium mustelinum]